MRRALLIAAAVVAIALVSGFTALHRSAGTAKPSLRITRSAPLTVQGRHFGAAERVRVTTGRRAAGARSNGAGTFVIAIPGADRCNTTRVVARGTAGSYAVVKILPGPACLLARSSR